MSYMRSSERSIRKTLRKEAVLSDILSISHVHMIFYSFSHRVNIYQILGNSYMLFRYYSKLKRKFITNIGVRGNALFGVIPDSRGSRKFNE